MKHICYASRADEVEKRLKKLAAKAERYGVRFSYFRGEEHPQEVHVLEIDPMTGYQHVAETYVVPAVDFEVDCESMICANGWQAVAKIEHGEHGNIVTTFGINEADPAWYSAPPRCDHCGTTRTRSVTFIVRHEDGSVKQVGKSCLHDYTGILPSLATAFAEVNDLFPSMDCTEHEWHEFREKPMYETETVLAHAVDVIKKYGYVKSEHVDSTRNRVLDRVEKHDDPSPEARETAKQLVAWLIDCGERARAIDAELNALYLKAYGHSDDYRDEWIEDEDAHQKYLTLRRDWRMPGDLERNCVPCAVSGYALAVHVGRLAYIPIAYQKWLAKKAKFEAIEAGKRSLAESSRHVGSIGERITVYAETAELVSSWETQYGYTYMYKFTNEGCVFVWFASSPADVTAGVTIKGTVKDHTERDGIKQTVLTRCKIM